MTSRMSVEESVRMQVETWNSHDGAAVAAAYAPDARVVDPAYADPLSGREAIQKDAADFFVAFPDITFRVTNVISKDGTVALEGHAGGTHKGPLALPTGLIPATNLRLEFDVAIFQELDASGSILAERRYYDVAGQLTQLGMMK